MARWRQLGTLERSESAQSPAVSSTCGVSTARMHSRSRRRGSHDVPFFLFGVADIFFADVDVFFLTLRRRRRRRRSRTESERRLSPPLPLVHHRPLLRVVGRGGADRTMSASSRSMALLADSSPSSPALVHLRPPLQRRPTPGPGCPWPSRSAPVSSPPRSRTSRRGGPAGAPRASPRPIGRRRALPAFDTPRTGRLTLGITRRVRIRNLSVHRMLNLKEVSGQSFWITFRARSIV